MDSTWMVLLSFMMGHGYKFMPSCIGGESSLSFTAYVVEEKDDMERDISKKRKWGRKSKNALGFFVCRFLGYIFLSISSQMD